MKKLRDILQDRELFHADEKETVAQVAARMVALEVGAIMIVTAGGELAGVFSERDLMKRVVVAGLDPSTTPVSAVMTRDLTTTTEDATVEEAMELMQRQGCRHLPVMRGTRPVGFISMRDLMRLQLSEKIDEVQHMRAYIQSSV